jgi:hypothetical protein
VPAQPFVPKVVSLAPLPTPVIELAPDRMGRPMVATGPAPKVRTVFSSPEMELVGTVFQLLRLMLRVHAMMRKPQPSQVQAGSWMETLANHFTDYADERPTLRPAQPRAFEISAADYMFELVQQLRRRDEFMAVLLLARAANVPWGKLVPLDPKKRGHRMMKYLRLSAAWEVVKLDAARKNLFPILPKKA